MRLDIPIDLAKNTKKEKTTFQVQCRDGRRSSGVRINILIWRKQRKY